MQWIKFLNVQSRKMTLSCRSIYAEFAKKCLFAFFRIVCTLASVNVKSACDDTLTGWCPYRKRISSTFTFSDWEFVFAKIFFFEKFDVTISKIKNKKEYLFLYVLIKINLCCIVHMFVSFIELFICLNISDVSFDVSAFLSLQSFIFKLYTVDQHRCT